MVFLIHTELRCTVNHTSDPLCSASQSDDKRLLRPLSTSYTKQFRHPQFLQHIVMALYLRRTTLKKKLVNFKFWSAAGLLRSIFLVLLGICILGAAVLGEIICFLSQHITHILSKIKHTSLRNFAVSLPFFQLPRRCNKSLDRSQSA